MIDNCDKMMYLCFAMRNHISLFLLAAAVLLFAGCGVLGLSSEEKKAEEARVEELVRQGLEARRFTIAVDHMYPVRGSSRYVGSERYSLTVDGAEVRSHLPYIGEAYQVPYGKSKVLNFDDQIEEYIDSVDARGRRIIVFSTDNDEDYIVYTLTVFENGQTDILVRCKNRQQISYRGHIDPDAFPEEE